MPFFWGPSGCCKYTGNKLKLLATLRGVTVCIGEITKRKQINRTPVRTGPREQKVVAYAQFLPKARKTLDLFLDLQIVDKETGL